MILAKKMVKGHRIRFSPQDFLNPVLQKHYANLQALALDRDVVEEVPDLLQPDMEGFQQV